ncbi:MAG: SH3 domain-containing protein [Vannielia sp.]|uniref:SH3 domain-containing protein n=1 Tax=Rhodobacterales TaxID=204455 RepID=UPI0020959A99|nr:SH3 domain-containing protein [Oceanicola sp. 502str15]MCO6382784.1 SH3 domain-containing protein [Oceanicola sp. 502str15]
MFRFIVCAMAAGTLTACVAAGPVTVGAPRYEVSGVEEGDMLKLRAGPGTGYTIQAGLPNGTVVRVRECSRIGGTRWCEVALDDSPGMTGYVSQTYLTKL